MDVWEQCGDQKWAEAVAGDHLEDEYGTDLQQVEEAAEDGAGHALEVDENVGQEEEEAEVPLRPPRGETTPLARRRFEVGSRHGRLRRRPPEVHGECNRRTVCRQILRIVTDKL